MQGKFLLNPHATPYVPLQKNFPGVSLGGDDAKVPKKTSGKSDNSEDVGLAGSCQLPASASVQVSDDLSPRMNDFSFLDEESDMMDALDSLSTRFPNYSTESLIALLNANQGDLRNTVDMLEELEDDGDVTQDFPESSEVHNNSVPASQNSDLAQPSSSTCSSRSSAQG